MSGPQVILRQLTFTFPRSVSFPTEKPEVLQVSVIPLASPSAPGQDLTFVDPPAVQDVVLLDTANTAAFMLIPSYWAGLTEPVLYRAQWRTGITGRTFSQDFAMPDADVSFSALGDLGNLISGENYLTQADLGVENRVARLNAEGAVVDAEGNPVALASALTALQAALDAEISDRSGADTDVASTAQSALETQLDATLAMANGYTDNHLAQVESLIDQEATGRAAADATLDDRIDGVASDLSDLQTNIQASLDTKADLSGGKIPIGQIPDAALSQVVPAANQTAMLALTTVQTGDFAIRPDGLFALTGTNPANLAHWTPLTKVSSINGVQGAVTFNLTDVAGRGGEVPADQVTGLTTALSDKADTSALSAVDTRVAAIENDTTLVRTSGGVIPHTLNDSSMAYINNSGQITTKAGVPISAGGLAKAAWFDAANDVAPLTDLTTFANTVALHGPFVKTSDGKYAYRKDGVAQTGQTYVYPYITPNGHLELREWNEANAADPALATQAALDALSTTVSTKATTAALTSLTTTVNGKAAQSALDTLSGTVATKADTSTVSALSTTVATKADTSTVTSLTTTVNSKAAQSDMSAAQSAITALQNGKADLVSGTVPIGQIPQLPTSQVIDLDTAFDAKADLVDGAVPTAQLGTIPQSSVDSLTVDLAAKADLDESGKVPTSQLPSLSLNNVTVVSTTTAMRAQTTSEVQPGDVTVVTSGSDRGSYMLTATDPSILGNWVKLSSSDGSVFTVNGQAGDVVLTAASVGARPSATPLAIADTTGLQTALDAKASSLDLTTAVTTRTTPADVANILQASASVKTQVARVATSAVASLSGSQSIDGGLTTIGQLVLLTAQTTSSQNGLWVSASGSWTRATDFATGSAFLKGTIVAVSAGTTYANTLWQQTAAAGIVGTNTNTWTKIGDIAPPYVPSAGNGINLSGDKTTFSVKNTTGISVTGSGVGIDTALVVRKAVGTVPSGSTTATLTHNLNTNFPMVQIIEVATGNLVSAPSTVASVNAVTVDFASAPASNQYRFVIVG